MGDVSVSKVVRETKNLTKKQRIQMLQLDAPELLAVADDVQQKGIVKELGEMLAPLRTFLGDPATQKYFARKAGQTKADEREKAFLEYLHAKEQFASIYLINLLFLMSLHAQKVVSRSPSHEAAAGAAVRSAQSQKA